MTDCALCGSLSSQRESEIIYEDELIFCKVNKYPVNDSHVMILPRRHVEDLAHLKPEELQATFALIDRLTKALMRSVDGSPILFMHFGNNKSQRHLHFHISSTAHGVRYYYSLAQGKKEYEDASDADLAEIRDRMRSLLEEKS